MGKCYTLHSESNQYESCELCFPKMKVVSCVLQRLCIFVEDRFQDRTSQVFHNNGRWDSAPYGQGRSDFIQLNHLSGMDYSKNGSSGQGIPVICYYIPYFLLYRVQSSILLPLRPIYGIQRCYLLRQSLTCLQ